ncbi:MAG: hypothetical protein WDW36_008350 [Sanguina aurantia]
MLEAKNNVLMISGASHPPGSKRWGRWAAQLQLAGLTSEQASAALASNPGLMVREPTNTDTQFSVLFEEIMRGTGISAAELTRVVAHRPELLRTSRSTLVVGNMRWFEARLGVTGAEWVQLVLGCRQLISMGEAALQERLEVLVRQGMGKEAVKACWVGHPALLNLSPSGLQAKFRVVRELFGMEGADVLRQTPAALLCVSRDMRERVMFLQQLQQPGDPRAADLSGGSCCEASGKSLPQLCRESLVLPGVPEYLKRSSSDPDTMSALKYFTMMVMIGRTKARAE